MHLSFINTLRNINTAIQAFPDSLLHDDQDYTT